MNVVPVVLAGGIGERFWPLSRSARPKQLLTIMSGKTMLEETLLRMAPLCDSDTVPLIMTGKAIARRVRASLGRDRRCKVIAEPVGKNTAPAIALAAAYLESKAPGSVMLVAPADHLIQPRTAFVKAAKHATQLAALKNRLVVFGIQPTRPDTGYGYIELGKLVGQTGKVSSHDVRRFVEKPNAQRARAYCKSKRYLWNSGMFVWRADVVLEEFAQYMPTLHRQVMEAAKQRFTQRAIDAFYQRCEKQSIDYGIMEQSKRVAAVRGTFSWDDIGSWEAIARVHRTNAKNTAVVGPGVCADDAADSIVVNDSKRAVAAVGVENLVVVATDDAVLVIPRERLSGIKEYLTAMKGRSDFPASLF